MKSSDARESGGLFEWAHLAYARSKDMNHTGLTSTLSVNFAKRGLQTPNLSDDVSAIENTRVTYWSPARVPEKHRLDMKDNPRLIPISWGKIFVAKRSVGARYGKCVRRGPAEVLVFKLEDQSRKTRSVFKWEMSP